MKTTIFKSLYFQVLTAITLGILLGYFYPDLGAQMKPLMVRKLNRPLLSFLTMNSVKEEPHMVRPVAE